MPPESSFEILKDYTDHIGFRHQTYQQYVAGVKVDGGIVKVHSRNGVVTSANGYVIDQAQVLRQMRRVAGRDAGEGNGQTMVLVEVRNGVRYAYKSYDLTRHEYVFTDVETGEIIKRLPRRYTANVLTKGESLYSGMCEFTVDQIADSRYALNDNVRKIYTLDARMASSDTSPYTTSAYKEGIDARRYILDNTQPLYNTDKAWSLVRIDSVSVDSIGPVGRAEDEGGFNFSTAVFYPNRFEKEELHSELRQNVAGAPFVIDISDFQTEAGMPSWLRLAWRGAAGDIQADIRCTATEPGVYPWHAEVQDGNAKRTIARGRYFVSRTSHFGVDVHWGMEQTYDFYKNMFHRDSYDGEGAPIYNIVYPLIGYGTEETPMLNFPTDNAASQAYESFAFMIYGFGGKKFKTVVALDVMAHEFTHLVTAKTADLEYAGESGALNESFSDIIGITVKQKAKNRPDNWIQGDEMMKDPSRRGTRDMKDPESMAKPGVYKGRYWVDTDSQYDHGGVHFNSSVQNHWYYYLSEGGEYRDADGYIHRFNGIGTDKAVQIVYRNLAEILTPKAQYADAAMGSVQAAEELFGEDSEEVLAVKAAWTAVGLESALFPTAIVPVASPYVHVSGDYVYNIDGTRMGGTPTKKLAPGIYIRNGKKVMAD